MNLDIMSLMAASAAVSESTAKSGLQSDPPATGPDGEQAEASFTDILQGLIETTSTQADIDPLAVTASGQAPAQPVEQAISAGQPLTLPQPGTGENSVLAAPTGENLPLTGNDLPVASALSDASGPAVVATTLPATAVEGAQTAPNPQAPMLAAAANPHRGASGEPIANASPGIQRPGATGWFSQSGAHEMTTAPVIRDQARSTPASAPAATPYNALMTDAEPDRPTPVTAQMLTAARAISHNAGRDDGRAPVVMPISNLGDALLTVEGTRPTVLPTIAATHAAAAAQPMAPLSAAVPALNMAQAGWDQALGQRLVFMARNGLENAELRLDPPQLGAVNVKLALQGDQAQLVLHSANAATRDVLESALPRLKEMFGAEGLQLDSAHVAERDAGGRDRSASGAEGWWAAEGEADDGTGAASNEQLGTVDQLTLPPGRIYEKV